MSNIKILNRKTLSGGSKYEYCPYCVDRVQKAGGDIYRDLRPLQKVTTAEPIKCADGSYKDYIDEHFECFNCHSEKITVNTFIRFYCCRADGTKYTEPRKPTMIWSKEKNDFVVGLWDDATHQYIEEVK